jgi:hypothetical protein
MKRARQKATFRPRDGCALEFAQTVHLERILLFGLLAEFTTRFYSEPFFALLTHKTVAIFACGFSVSS